MSIFLVLGRGLAFSREYKHVYVYCEHVSETK